MQAVANASLGAAPGNVNGSAGAQSPPPRMPGLSPCVSLQPEQATKPSPSGSVSSAGTAAPQALLFPSHSPVAPGWLFGSASLQSVPRTTGRDTVASP